MSNNHETRETSHGALETCIKHQGSKNCKLINKFTCPEQGRRTNSLVLSNVEGPINQDFVVLSCKSCQNPARKSNLFMQNKANLYHGHLARGSFLSLCNINRYVNMYPVILSRNEQKNKAKQSQFKPNFRPKLALFFQYWLCYSLTFNGKNTAMHRFIMKPAEGLVVDHIDGNGLNNTRANLRICTYQQNICNRKGWGKDSKYKGVCWDIYNKKWRAQINFNRECRYLGVFEDEIEAAKEYDKHAKKLFGEFAYLNFPDDNQST